MINKLRKLNEKLVEINKDNKKDLEKQLLIQKLLKDEKCFFKVSIEQAFAILRDLTIPEENVESVYMELIDIKSFLEKE